MAHTDDVHLLTPGRVVRLRERLWRVDYRDGSVFGATALDGRDNRPTRFHAELEHVQSGELPFPDPSAIGEGTRFKEDLEADSLDLLTLVQELEDSYGVSMTDEQAAQITTVGQAVEFVLAHAPPA